MTNEFLRTSKGKNDECYTPRYGVEPLLEFIQPFKNKTIWCPFDTQDSEYVKVFRENGYSVVSSHIKNGQDFYNYEPEKWDIIISNPPFTGKTKIFERALSFKKPFALLMTITWLNDPKPAKVFKKENLQILSFDERMVFKGQDRKKINFMSAYFCHNFLPQDFIFRSLKENRNQMRLKI
ncbi:tRNA (adenine-N(6)-)-methyltransferase [bacterium]|nr:tRNA (adenine-N(6)-)-methyltransferase [bacterium]